MCAKRDDNRDYESTHTKRCVCVTHSVKLFLISSEYLRTCVFVYLNCNPTKLCVSTVGINCVYQLCVSTMYQLDVSTVCINLILSYYQLHIWHTLYVSTWVSFSFTNPSPVNMIQAIISYFRYLWDSLFYPLRPTNAFVLNVFLLPNRTRRRRSSDRSDEERKLDKEIEDLERKLCL